MTTNKGDVTLQETGGECCMCGDCGLSYELFRCKICLFRSQHRYCSNLYPKAESYSVCNWCLINQKENSKEKSQNSSNALNSSPNTSEDDRKSRKKTQNFPETQMSIKTSPIKKQRSTSPPVRRRRLIRLEEKLRRTKSEESADRGVITRYVFRNKVRRYKLLDEVSS